MKALRPLGWGAALLLLALVFAAYLHPEMMFSLATQVWNCF